MRTHPTPSCRVIGSLLLTAVTSMGATAQSRSMASTPGTAERLGGGGDTLYVPPGFSFTSAYYCWVDAGGTATGEFVLDTPVSWIDSLYTPAGSTSTDCSDPFPIIARIHAPMIPGVYTADVSDISGEWAGWTYIVKVADVPTQVDGVFTDTLDVGALANLPASADATVGVTGLGCPSLPYLPTPDITFEYRFHPAAAWISITPDSLVVPAGTTAFPVIDVQSAVPGNFTTYRYRSQTWYGRPQVLQYNAVFETASSSPELTSGVGSLTLHPNPVSDVLTILIPQDIGNTSEVVFTDMAGREVLRTRATLQSAGNVSVDVSRLQEGAYITSVVLDGNGRSLLGRILVAH